MVQIQWDASIILFNRGENDMIDTNICDKLVQAEWNLLIKYVIPLICLVRKYDGTYNISRTYVQIVVQITYFRHMWILKN